MISVEGGGNMSVVSFFLTGPNDTVEEKVNNLIKENEARNPRYKAFVKILNSTTDGCGPGTTQHTYSLELVHEDDLENEDE